MRQRHSCISHGSNVEHNALRSWHATMYEFVTSMVLCGLGMQQCAMYNATIRKTPFFELGVYINDLPNCVTNPSPECMHMSLLWHLQVMMWITVDRLAMNRDLDPTRLTILYIQCMNCQQFVLTGSKQKLGTLSKPPVRLINGSLGQFKMMKIYLGIIILAKKVASGNGTFKRERSSSSPSCSLWIVWIDACTCSPERDCC